MGLGSGVQSVGFEGFQNWDVGFEAPALVFVCLAFRGLGSGFSLQGSHVRVDDLGLTVSGLTVEGFGLSAEGSSSRGTEDYG